MTDFNRDRWGRPLIVVPGEPKPVAYTRFSSHGQCLEDRFGLEKWKIRTAGKGLANRTDLYAQVAACPPEDSRRLDQLMEAALEAGGSSVGAGLGTALHEFTQNHDLGTSTLDEIPEPWRHDVAAYTAALKAHHLEIDQRLIEIPLVHDDLRLAGTADRFYRRPDGTLICADIKTGKQIGDNPLAYIVQLAAYANSVRYDIETGTRTPVGTVDLHRGLLVHLPAGRAECTIYEVDLEAGIELARLASAVRTQQKRRGLVSRVEPADGTPAAPTEPAAHSPEAAGSAPQQREWLATRIGIIRGHKEAFEALRTIWPTDLPTLKQADNHTDTQLGQIAKICDNIEALYGLPFGDTEPGTATPPPPRRSTTTAPEALEADIDEGPKADKTNISDLRRILAELPDEQKTWVQAQTKRANAAGQSISLKALPSLRRYNIAHFLIAASRFADDDILRAVLANYTEWPLDSGKNIGYVLGTMSADNAARAAALTLAIEAGDIILGYDDDGTPSLTGPVHRYQPNPT